MHRVRREKMANSELSDILRASGFRFNKALGQNFIFDGNLLDAIVSDAGVTAEDTVVEIGTGAGTLTARLAARAKKVFSFEVDERLRPVLDISLKGAENVEVVFRDVMKMKDDELREMIGGEFKVVANLPYYITTPLIMRFAESTLPVRSITVMVQKEVADRLTAEVGSADYAAVTLAVKVFGDAAVTRIVDRHMFRPAPNVDSAVVRIDRVLPSPCAARPSSTTSPPPSASRNSRRPTSSPPAVSPPTSAANASPSTTSSASPVQWRADSAGALPLH